MPNPFYDLLSGGARRSITHYNRSKTDGAEAVAARSMTADDIAGAIDPATIDGTA
jgi:hypothetical protein